MVVDGEPSINMPVLEKCISRKCCLWPWPWNLWPWKYRVDL